MSYMGELEFENYQQRWNARDTTTSITSILLAAVVGVYVIFTTLDLLGYPVWLWIHQFVHMSVGVLRSRVASMESSDSSSSDDMLQRSGGLLGSIFGLNPGNLLQKGVRGVAGALSMGPSHVPPGLGNISNSCYQNSVIQGLASLPSLRDYLSKMITEHTSLNTDTTNGALYDMIGKLNDPHNHGQHFWIRGKLKSMSTFQQQDAQEYFSKVLDALDEEVKKASRSRRRSSVSWLEATKDLSDLPEADGHYQDSERDGAETVHTQVERSRMIPNPLDGLLAQRVGCVTCGYSEGLSLIPFNCVTVSLGKNYRYDIRECLDEYTTLEYIDGVECAKCTLLKLKNTLTPLAANKPGSAFESKLNAVQETLDEEDFEDKTLVKKLNVLKKNWIQSTKSKQAVIARAPRSLVLHVNRSSFNETTGMSYKNNAGVSYPRVLDLSNWCLGSHPSDSQHPHMSIEEWPRDPRKSMLPDSQSDPVTTSPFMYKLRAAVTHYGSHGSGHYVCYRPHPRVASQSEQTSEDSQGSVKQEEEVGKEQWWRFSDDSVFPVAEENVHQGNVFMLFYERIDGTLSPSPLLQEANRAMEVTTVHEDAPLPPADAVIMDTWISANEEAPEVPLPGYDDDLFDLVPEVSATLSKEPSAFPLLASEDVDTEMSETESEDAPSTQLTSNYDSEDSSALLTPKILRIPPVSPHMMRTAGNASARRQGSRQTLPLISAT